MRRWWVVIALLLSVGVNIGILATLATRQATRPDREPQRRETPPPPRPPKQPEEEPRRAEPPPPPAPEVEEPEEGPGREQPPPPPPPGPDEPGEEPGGEGPDDLPLPRAGRLADHLGLEGDERRRFLEIQQRFFEETVRIRLHLGETQREVRRELVADQPDRQRIGELLDASARDYLALEQALAKNVVSTREILNPEQEQEFLRFVARLRAPGPGGRMGQPPPRPPRRRPPPWRRRL